MGGVPCCLPYRKRDRIIVTRPEARKEARAGGAPGHFELHGWEPEAEAAFSFPTTDGCATHGKKSKQKTAQQARKINK